MLFFATVVSAYAFAVTQPTSQGQCVGGPFMVFFDFDKDELTASSKTILTSVAGAYQACKGATINIAGHADTVGEESYNVGLSQRRANSVRNYLENVGLEPQYMLVQAFGESRPLARTKDGQKEPLNRRVEITYTVGSRW